MQATVETTGTLLVGSDISAVLTSVEPLGIDVLGLNCATGPDEMHAHLQTLCEASPFRISCLPNAGLPVNVGGQVVYPLDPAAFAPKVLHAATEFGLAIVGGCCGTTPDHIRALAAGVEKLNVPRRTPKLERSAASLYQSVTLRQEPAPLIVGERTNANGSKKFRDLLAAEDWDGMITLAKEQQKEGAHLLDLCVAYVGRDEVRDADELLGRLVSQITLPLMIDSTEFPVIERALQRSPGKCVVNSINFEDGEAKARKILDLCKTYGAAVVALTIDERGMAKTREQKLAVAKRLHALVVGEYGLDPGDLIIDPLTFTLGSGDEEFRGSAVETLEALKLIKAELPGVMTILGVSNVSFGLNPASRHVVNALMLYHGVKHGLDMAIFNASKVIPVAKIDPEDRRMVEDLIFDRRWRATTPSRPSWRASATARPPGGRPPRRPARAGAPAPRHPRWREAGHPGGRGRGPEGPRPPEAHQRGAAGRHEGGGRALRRRRDAAALRAGERRGHEGGHQAHRAAPAPGVQLPEGPHPAGHREGRCP